MKNLWKYIVIGLVVVSFGIMSCDNPAGSSPPIDPPPILYRGMFDNPMTFLTSCECGHSPNSIVVPVTRPNITPETERQMLMKVIEWLVDNDFDIYFGPIRYRGIATIFSSYLNRYHDWLVGNFYFDNNWRNSLKPFNLTWFNTLRFMNNVGHPHWISTHSGFFDHNIFLYERNNSTHNFVF